MSDLVKLYQQTKDEKVFKKIYEKYYKTVFLKAKRYCPIDQAAEDITQETMIKISANIDKYDSSKGAFSAWISRVCIYTALDWLRKKRACHSIDESMNDIPELESRVSPEFVLIQNEVISAIDNLHEDYRIILELYLIAEYTIKEIADHLDRSYSYIKSTFRRGINKLQADLIHLKPNDRNANNVRKQTKHSIILAKIQEIYGIETLFSLQNYLDIIGDKYLQSRRSTSFRPISDYAERFSMISSKL